MSLRLIHCLAEYGRSRPGAVAVRQVDEGELANRELTYGELHRRVAAFAARLSKEVRPGDVVLLCCPNQPMYFVAFLGILAAGATVFPLNPELTEPELLAAARRSNAAAVIGTDPAIAALRSTVPLAISIAELNQRSLGGDSAPINASSSGALILQSSGTTGLPKLALRSGQSLDAVAWNMCQAIGIGSSDHILATLPLCHSYGMEHGLLAPIAAGGCVHLCRGFDLAIVMKQLQRAGITVFPAVPSVFEILSRIGGQSDAFPTLRRAYSAGAPLPRAIYDALQRRYGVKVSQLYGATEIGSVTFNDPLLDGFDSAAVGRPMNDVKIRILDIGSADIDRTLPVGVEGQVAVAAPSMFNGYIGESSSGLIDGYFLTGDLGRLDPSGALTITGRLKLLIDIGGLKVNPMEVEEILLQHPAVGACAVVPIQLSQTLFRLKAIVTPRDGGMRLSADALRDFARRRLAPYKVPRVFEIRHALPRSATGKVLRHLLETTA